MTDKLESLYEYLADEEDARVCKDIPDSACREVPKNFFVIFITQFLTKLGDSLASSKVVLPWLLTSIGAPAFFSGILVPIRESGSMLPQLFIGGLVRQYRVRKWFFVLGAAFQGFAIFAIACVGLSFEGFTAGLLVTLLLIGFSLGRGLCSVASGFVTIGVGVGLLVFSHPDVESYVFLLFAAGLC